MSLKILQNLQENTFAGVSILIKLEAEAYSFIQKETPTKAFSCKFCAIFKNTIFHRTPPVAVSAPWKSSSQKTLHDSSNRQVDPKILQTASILHGDQQINLIKNVLESIQKTMETLST